MKKVLFLDVDGVLNNGEWASKMYGLGVHVYKEDLLYEPSLKQLKRIVQSTGALIVVSSAWRQIPTCYRHLQEWLQRYGLEIYGKTPYVGGERGNDISAWFHLHPGEWQYAILDDDCDMGVHLSHLVLTDFDTGLTEKEANQCIELLNGMEGE